MYELGIFRGMDFEVWTVQQESLGWVIPRSNSFGIPKIEHVIAQLVRPSLRCDWDWVKVVQYILNSYAMLFRRILYATIQHSLLYATRNHLR